MENGKRYFLNFIARSNPFFNKEVVVKQVYDDEVLITIPNKPECDSKKFNKSQLFLKPPMYMVSISDDLKRLFNPYLDLCAENIDRINGNFYSIDINSEKVTFIPRKKIEDILKQINLEMETSMEVRKEIEHFVCSEQIYKKYSQQISIGKFIKNMTTLNNATEKEIENLVNDIKTDISYMKDINKKIKILIGEDIRKYYLAENYALKNTGTLKNSCMRYKDCQKYMDVYVENCEMMTIMEKDNKISARVIIWTDMYGKKYYDRIYGNEISIQAIEKECKALKYINIRDNEYYSNDDDGDENEDLSSVLIPVKRIYSFMPYMDTIWFQYKDKDGKILLSNTRIELIENQYNLKLKKIRTDMASTCGNEIKQCVICKEYFELEELHETIFGYVNEIYISYSNIDNINNSNINTNPTSVSQYIPQF